MGRLLNKKITPPEVHADVSRLPKRRAMLFQPLDLTSDSVVSSGGQSGSSDTVSTCSALPTVGPTSDLLASPNSLSEMQCSSNPWTLPD
ncbi:hypothetical protein L6452_00208 [Arctium lappa]|uniref:Uncharacterized protein n=1 Tax=Arctium lappa TaxID=4217 RepID=A0ACB9FCU3_ARCLA|nr:hypothetical protein L6452_00208 [Arctium lappa]